eukprot:scaffold93601_cov32-Tisochrysis_lutea.AAC.9
MHVLTAKIRPLREGAAYRSMADTVEQTVTGEIGAARLRRDPGSVQTRSERTRGSFLETVLIVVLASTVELQVCSGTRYVVLSRVNGPERMAFEADSASEGMWDSE